jgi:hypothetical protein
MGSSGGSGWNESLLMAALSMLLVALAVVAGIYRRPLRARLRRGRQG